MEKYAIKFLFQFRVVSTEECKMRTTEEKIVLFHINSKDNNNFFEIANKRAKEDEFNYLNDDNNMVYYEYIGIVDICHLGIEVDDDVLWYDIKTLLTPMERKNKILPNISQLKKRIFTK
ncbi:MAG TPA: DUF4288 domain-containing protein [Flavobacteriaceae bacterium]|nr:DUF4288 domain-containing protein [Flavobacteriaceae bacterium]